MAEITVSRDAERQIRVDVWSDIACPFCYMGTTALKQAVDRFPYGGNLEVVYHSFELTPQMPARYDGGAHEFLAKEQHIPVEQAAAITGQLAARARMSGLDFRFDKVVMGNTHTAHRLIHFALEHGKQREMVERLFRAHFTEGLFVGDHAVLADLAEQVGLDRAAALSALESGGYEQEVAADLRRARSLGLQGVPFYLFDDQYALTGAQPVERFLQVLDRVWNTEQKQAS